MTPEFHRPLALDRIGAEPFEMEVEASPAERAALATRFALPAIPTLACRFRLTRVPGGEIDAEGDLRARVVQTCVVSLEDFEADVEERFSVRFVRAGSESEDEDPESTDEIPYEGGTIDLGEAAAEQLALALDPYPHKPGAALPESGGDEASGPFAALAAFRRRQQ